MDSQRGETAGNLHSETSPDYRIAEARRTYREIMVRSEHILGYLTLVSYVLTHPPRTHEVEEDLDDEQTDDQAAGSLNADADTQDDRRWGAPAKEQRGDAEFVVMQACGTLVSHEVQGLLRAVSRLVGVEDFSIRVDEESVHGD
ncbi:hypothetical protein NEMBOFW57_009540 [Staphylotrichum longicolle]|uniref:Uncharacterized protein n=1 Tax=Staphylotrichum longicolle TaxID=669026 RepID=A0AAD4HW19_9PEZI|nr:hypothetical protein NEMBOFW57_009540 [Staphylotrichum longicolle]